MATPFPSRLFDSTLPPAFSELPTPPAELFLHGALPAGPVVGIVGTRKPTLEAAAYCFQLAQCLAASGVAVVSGGALGIDTHAHQGALEGGGRTVVVAPSSFDRPYPVENAALFARIVAEGGGFLSAFAEQAPARTNHFFARNSYLVALCHALVLVEAPLRSGARNAALWARRLRRPLFVVPATPWNPRGLGCIVEMKLGARPLYSYRDVLECLVEQGHAGLTVPKKGQILPLLHIAQELLPGEGLNANGCPTSFDGTKRKAASLASKTSATPPQAVTPSALEKLGPRAALVFEAVRLGARHPDTICSMSGLPMSEVTQMLLTLTLSQLLHAHPTGAYTVASVK